MPKQQTKSTSELNLKDEHQYICKTWMFSLVFLIAAIWDPLSVVSSRYPLWHLRQLWVPGWIKMNVHSLILGRKSTHAVQCHNYWFGIPNGSLFFSTLFFLQFTMISTVLMLSYLFPLQATRKQQDWKMMSSVGYRTLISKISIVEIFP